MTHDMQIENWKTTINKLREKNYKLLKLQSSIQVFKSCLTQNLFFQGTIDVQVLPILLFNFYGGKQPSLGMCLICQVKIVDSCFNSNL